GLSEQAFVSDCLRALKFNGGFQNLHNCLLHASKHLVPLLPAADGGSRLGPSKAPEVFNSAFWSKGQGTAIEFLLFGTNASQELLQEKWGIAERTSLYNRSKGGLTILVLDRPELDREHFV